MFVLKQKLSTQVWQKVKGFLTHTHFLITITISLSYYCVKMFILVNIWMTEKNSKKPHYLKKNIFTVT